MNTYSGQAAACTCLVIVYLNFFICMCLYVVLLTEINKLGYITPYSENQTFLYISISNSEVALNANHGNKPPTNKLKDATDPPPKPAPPLPTPPIPPVPPPVF